MTSDDAQICGQKQYSYFTGEDRKAAMVTISTRSTMAEKLIYLLKYSYYWEYSIYRSLLSRKVDKVVCIAKDCKG